MNIRLTLRVQGGLLMFLAAMLLTPVPFSLAHPRPGTWHDGALGAFLSSSLLALAVGAALHRFCRAEGEMTYREGFAIVTCGWIFFALFGGLPYMLADIDGIRHVADAFFEAMSGFSTTGATVISDLERTPQSILFWRAMTQWLGGMGIIVLSLAILPFLRVGGMQLFEAESPGPTKDRLSPRIQDTAKVLWGVYATMTLVQIVLLWAGGMSLFESVCHAFATMATGGFSTRNASVGAFGSYIHVVTGVFMVLAGVGFSLHFHAFRGDLKRYWRSEEFRFYLAIIAGATAVVATLILARPDIPGHPLIKVRDAAFQTISLMTTTGFVTADFEKWPALAQYILMMLMFVGGCAGSTGGSIKVIRILLLSKHAILQISRLIHPREVRSLKLDHQPVSREVIQSVLGFFALFIAIFVLGSGLMAGLLPPQPDGTADLTTAWTSVASALGNVGPGLGTVGPTDTYTHLPAAGKFLLALCMLVGRLEVFTVLVLFFPSFWKK